MNLNFILGIILSIGWLYILYYMSKKRVRFPKRVISSLIVGLIFGIIFKESSSVLSILGTIYISFIKMLVIPLVITLIIVNLTNFNGNGIKKITFKSIGWLMGTTLIAALLGLVLGKLFNVGEGIAATTNTTDFIGREIPNLTSLITNNLPSNPFQAMSEGKILPIIIFSVVIAIAINKENEKNSHIIKPVKDFFIGFEKIMFRGIKMILKFTPYGVFGLIASTASSYGISTLLPLGKFIFVLYLACLIQVYVIDSLLIFFVGKTNPIKFFKGIYPAQLVAFTTCSSYGTLPVTIKSLVENIKTPEPIASFTASLGSTMGMNACGGIYPVLVALFVSKVFGIELTAADYILLVIVTPLSSIGVAGVPGTASMMATIVLTALGLPIEGLAILLSIDAIIDMGRTATNVTGSAVAAFLVGKTCKNIDELSTEKEVI